MNDRVLVVDPDPRWPQMFEAEASRIRAAAGPRLVELHASLKRDLAARFAHDRVAYTSGKSEFIAACLPGARVQGR